MMAETVALGAAYAAGLAVGYWPDRQVLRRHWQRAGEWRPQIDPNGGTAELASWRHAVSLARAWGNRTKAEPPNPWSPGSVVSRKIMVPSGGIEPPASPKLDCRAHKAHRLSAAEPPSHPGPATCYNTATGNCCSPVGRSIRGQRVTHRGAVQGRTIAPGERAGRSRCSSSAAGRRPRVQIPLGVLAAQRPQNLACSDTLHSFGGDQQVQVAAQCQQCPQESLGRRVGVDVRDEGDVDLDRLHCHRVVGRW